MFAHQGRNRFGPFAVAVQEYGGLLKASIKKFGVVKPIILNGTGVLTAGHQRIRAMREIGLETTPAIMLKDISLHDEIKFNLFHNSIETDRSEVRIANIHEMPLGYSYTTSDHLICGINQNATVTKHIADLYLRYGNWGSVVADETGRVILNSDYAITMKFYRQPVLVFKVMNDLASELLNLMNRDYGEYHFKALNIKPFVQYHCQMNRVKSDEWESLRSTLYENYAIPNLDRSKRYVDFGAGKFVYVNYLRDKGYEVHGYEPYFKKNNHEIFIARVIKDIDNLRRDIILNKLYEVVILDSVINSVTSLDYEKYVLTCCNALMKADGVLYLATRSLESVERRTRATKATVKSRIIEFLDKENFSATFRQGNWTLQHFHSVDSLQSLLKNYFHQVEVTPGSSQNYAICSDPIALSEDMYREALTEEFNIEYPKNFRHNNHEKLVSIILELLKERNAPGN